MHIAQKAVACGVDCLAVASVQEGAQLRQAGITAPILLFGLTLPDEIPDIVQWNLQPFVCDMEFIELLEKALEKNSDFKKAGVKYPVHLKIDTGMGRIGCAERDVSALALYISKSPYLHLQGVCTHFAVSDSLESRDIAYTNNQIHTFTKSIDAIKKQAVEPGIRHCSASGGILMYPHAHFDMVRAGIIAYGYFPSKALKTALSEGREKLVKLKPVMELTAPVVSIKTLKAGQSVSYGRTWTAQKDTRIATLPIGYGDGLPRNAAPGLHVGIGDSSYPVVGRICMDQCMVDIGKNSDVQRWDEALIFGPGANSQTAENIAELVNTIHYEILTGISARVPRIMVP